jgi:hypothetical protein
MITGQPNESVRTQALSLGIICYLPKPFRDDASPAAADPTGIAVVESLTGNLSGVESMDYVRAGQVIRLGPHQTIVLSYMASCVRETITGGTVTVGSQRSEVQSGHVRRIEGHCYSGRMELTGEEAHVGGRVFRGPAH